MKAKINTTGHVLAPGQLWKRNSGLYNGHIYLAVSLFEGGKIELVDVTDKCKQSWTGGGDDKDGFGHVGQEGFDFVGTLEIANDEEGVDGL